VIRDKQKDTTFVFANSRVFFIFIKGALKYLNFIPDLKPVFIAPGHLDQS